MSTIPSPQPVSIPASPGAFSPGKSGKTWLVGPWFDLLFMANLAWPIAVLLALNYPIDINSPLSLFQAYLLSTPHRWITLVLVFCDSERFWKEPAKFGGLAIGLILLGLGLVGVAGLVTDAKNSLILLIVLDYTWNAWHFASQHAGISRIYGRITRPDQSLPHAEFEKWAIRSLVLWVYFRPALLTLMSPYGESVQWIALSFRWIDPLVLIPAGVLIYRELAAFRAQSLGRFVYIFSVVSLYTALLIAMRVTDTQFMATGSADLQWMLAFFFASAIFHAVEYLAICNWSIQKRTTGIWHYQITRTGPAVLVFMVTLGAASYFVNAQSMYAWQLTTLLVSLLHYGYDGIIWRTRPAPA